MSYLSILLKAEAPSEASSPRTISDVLVEVCKLSSFRKSLSSIKPEGENGLDAFVPLKEMETARLYLCDYSLGLYCRLAFRNPGFAIAVNVVALMTHYKSTAGAVLVGQPQKDVTRKDLSPCTFLKKSRNRSCTFVEVARTIHGRPSKKVQGTLRNSPFASPIDHQSQRNSDKLMRGRPGGRELANAGVSGFI